MSPEKMIEEEGNYDVFLLEAMICSVCFMHLYLRIFKFLQILKVFDEPKQLQCGHSFCKTCIDRLCNEVEQKYSCPLCRAHFTSPPVVNYSLKSLISRIKERDAMVKCCHQCSHAVKPEDQYCCDDCDHTDRIERVRCGLCVINGHAKMGHAVSKYGESNERVKTAQQTLKEMINETVQFLQECKKLASDRFSFVVINLFKLLDEQYTQFSALETALDTNGFISKKDIEIKLEHARRLHGIYMRSASEFTGLMNTMFNEIAVLTEKTGVELAGHAVYGDIINKRDLIAQSAQEQTQSWFEYQRTGRFSALCSAIARRSAAVARRHLMTSNIQSEPEVIVNIMPPISPAAPVTPALPVYRDGALLVHQT
uniref:RING-type domain-containing protein n=1 Tax=Loa loa TaxID=7209 RepID=A0A1I7VRI9_LOALO